MFLHPSLLSAPIYNAMATDWVAATRELPGEAKLRRTPYTPLHDPGPSP